MSHHRWDTCDSKFFLIYIYNNNNNFKILVCDRKVNTCNLRGQKKLKKKILILMCDRKNFIQTIERRKKKSRVSRAFRLAFVVLPIFSSLQCAKFANTKTPYESFVLVNSAWMKPRTTTHHKPPKKFKSQFILKFFFDAHSNGVNCIIKKTQFRKQIEHKPM